MKNILGLASVTLMLAVGQALFKQVAMSIRGMPISEALLVILRQPLFYVSLLIYGLATLLWIWILSRVPLSQAYPWVALRYSWSLFSDGCFSANGLRPPSGWDWCWS